MLNGVPKQRICQNFIRKKPIFVKYLSKIAKNPHSLPTNSALSVHLRAVVQNRQKSGLKF